MRPFILATALAVAFPVAAAAQSFTAVNDLDVLPLSKTTFEVIEANGEGPRGMWCAAADYAEKRLHAKGRIYISEGRGASRSRSGRKSVVFTTDAGSLTKGPFQSISIGTSQVGIGLPINHALQFCRRDEYELGALNLRRK